MTDRLTPEHETAIATRAASRAAALTAWLNRVSPLSDGQREVENVEAVMEEDVPALLAELAAVRAERDELAARARYQKMEGAL